ncbi:hypothetical protein N665_0841s0019 [Sinapis alba]|nr:hypothetical protein N665_0841s0019 [Sinapis alba]
MILLPPPPDEKTKERFYQTDLNYFFLVFASGLVAESEKSSSALGLLHGFRCKSSLPFDSKEVRLRESLSSSSVMTLCFGLNNSVTVTYCITLE